MPRHHYGVTKLIARIDRRLNRVAYTCMDSYCGRERRPHIKGAPLPTRFKYNPEMNYYCVLMHVYDVRPHKNKRGVDLISDVLPFGRLWYDNATRFTAAAHIPL